MRGPRQVVPARAGASATAAARVTAHPTTLDPNCQPVTLRLVQGHDPKSRQAPNPRTIPSRSHLSSLVGCTSRENTIQSRMANVGSVFVVQAAEQTAHPNAVRAGGRVLLLICLDAGAV
jgi:hypothetical protein